MVKIPKYQKKLEASKDRLSYKLLVAKQDLEGLLPFAIIVPSCLTHETSDLKLSHMADFLPLNL